MLERLIDAIHDPGFWCVVAVWYALWVALPAVIRLWAAHEERKQ